MNADQQAGDIRVVTGATAGSMRLQVLLPSGDYIDLNGVKAVSLIADNTTVPPTIARADLSNVTIISQARIDTLEAAAASPAAPSVTNHGTIAPTGTSTSTVNANGTVQSTGTVTPTGTSTSTN